MAPEGCGKKRGEKSFKAREQQNKGRRGWPLREIGGNSMGSKSRPVPKKFRTAPHGVDIGEPETTVQTKTCRMEGD